MECQLIQTDKIGDNNKAEKEMLQFLKGLPAGYFIYRELKVTPSYLERIEGSTERKPDFVVVSGETGLVSIEVKDWNLDYNTYEWKNQYKVLKKNHMGEAEEIDNPMIQVDNYLRAFIELTKNFRIFVTSILAYPRISRQDFLNKFEKVEIFKDPQTKYFLNMDMTIFKEDLDRNFMNPQGLFKKIVRNNQSFFSSDPRTIEKVNAYIMPNSFRIGDYSKRQQNKQLMKIISKKQEEWIFNTDKDSNYLLDVAGSGKTNALVSKAIHLADISGNNPVKILITTYSDNLEKNIRRIFNHKIASEENKEKYMKSIDIISLPAMMEMVVTHFYGISREEYRRNKGACKDNLGTCIKKYEEKYEKELRNDIIDIMDVEPKKYKKYDYVFVDEIQDFDNFYLVFANYLCKNSRFFFVGDLGQKIYQREHDLKRIGILKKDVELPKSFKMYRTPMYISMLATQFIYKDLYTRREFENSGYKGNFDFQNKLDNAAVILKSLNPEKDIADKIESLKKGGILDEDIMIITSSEKIKKLEDVMMNAGIPVSRGETEEGGSLVIVDFMNVKGLEKDVVIVYGIEDLYHSSKDEGIFDSEDEKNIKERLSRKLIYIALTRTIEQLYIYYTDSLNPYISQLISINKNIEDKRQAGEK